MAADSSTATPPASSGGLTSEQVQQAIAAQLKPLADAVASLGESQKSIAQLLQQQPGGDRAAKDAAADAAGKALSKEDVASIVGDQLKTFTQSQQQTAARQQYQDQKLKDLPAVYRNQLGNDPTKWATEEQQIRDAYKADFTAAGGKVAPVGGDTTTTARKVGDAIDLSKLSPQQLAEMALKDSKPAAGSQAVNTTVAPASGAAAAA